MAAKSDILFEVSWEVCNKVGGIFTVVTSKAALIKEQYQENYFLVGPYFKENVSGNFEEKEPPVFLKNTFDKIKDQGIICHFGHWLIDGDPNTILIEYSGFAHNNNKIKAKLWESFKIDSLGTSYYDYDEPMVWSTSIGILIEEAKKNLKDKNITAQFHEWMSGGGLLYLKHAKANVATVFTTHATMLGRTLVGKNIDLYSIMDKINPEEEAYRYNIQAKHLTEKACATNADCFTTVSEITGIEARHFLGKKPDVLLPNGLNIDIFPTFEDASIKHKFLKQKILDFLMYYFFPYYSFDIDNTLLYFLAGRYEFRTKGIDVLLKSLSRLNQKLIEEKSEKTIVVLILVPGFAEGIKSELINNKTLYDDLKDSLYDISGEIMERLKYGLLAKHQIDDTFLLGDSLHKETRKRLVRYARDGLPPICTHNLSNESTNDILNGIRDSNLLNSKDDKVKVIYYPIYLTGRDSLLGLNYYETIVGSHFGIFPSYYEPWGYTPAETGSLGVASLTTDLAGFGRYIEKMDKGNKNKGIFVLKRHNKTDEEVIEQLAEIMHTFSQYSKQDRIENKLKAKRIAAAADWKLLIHNYTDAHDFAQDRMREK